jgi:hypothetical protein
MKKFQNKYRIESTRLKYWDYSNPGMYFITICTHNFVEWFGTINDRKFGPLKKGSLSTIVGSYKSAVTRTIQKTENPDFNGNPGFMIMWFEMKSRWKTSNIISSKILQIRSRLEI